jgi:RNA recognition motif-containing protein
MATKLFVGSLPWSVTDDQLKDFFSAAGTVVSANVVVDRDTNRSRGFGFVEMSTDEEAQEAVKKLNNADLGGRTIIVSEARPKADRPQGGNGGGGGYNRDRY